MTNKIPNFSDKEWKMMENYRENSGKEPRQNLIELISHVDPSYAQMGMNSAPYYMLDRLLTDEQIDFANHLKLRTPVYIEEIAEKSGKSVEEAARLAHELCTIGVLVYKPDEKGIDRIELPIFVVGILEQLLLGGLNEDQYENYPEIAVGFVDHTTQMATGSAHLLPPANYGVHRPVPVETALKNETRVEDYEKLEELIEKSAHGSYSVCECICRKIRKQYGELCDDPDMEWCMPIGYYADYAVRTGKARRITKEEYYEKLRKAESLGYVHNVCNHEGPDLIEYVCNCDYKSCMSLRAGLYTNAFNVQKSNFVAKVDPEKCVACGNCVETCPDNAVRLGQQVPQKKKVDYVDQDTPFDLNTIMWGKEHWDPDYLDHRQDVRHETGTSPCKTNCPAHIAVQGYLRLAGLGRYRDALELIKQENPLPAICGNICNRRCESACTRNHLDESVSVDEVKKFLAYREINSEDRFIPEKKRDHGKKIAVIGAGPAGLSAAYFLAIEGHDVTVFDKNAEPGGMLRYGIPSFRLEKDIISAEIEVIKELGVEFRCGIEIGRDTTIQKLRDEGYAGFLLAIGAQKSSALNINGEDLEGVYGGVEYLRAVNTDNSIKTGKNVAVIGGGNVAVDVVRTAVRNGAENAYIVYRRSEEEMPADEAEIEEAKEEGVQFRFLNAPVEIIGENGKVKALRVEVMTLGEADEKGRRKPVGTGKYETIEVDNVIGAIGQKADWGMLDTGLLQRGTKGLAKADAVTYQTDEPDIFTAGDIYTGPKFAIDAIAAGKQAAISLNRYVWGNNLTLARDHRDYEDIDFNNLDLTSFDTAKRQKPKADASKKNTMRDDRGVFTEEQVKCETSRCLRCGAAHVDEARCIGCGVCTTRCKMDAITLYKKYDVEPVPNELMMKGVGAEVVRRIDAKYPKNPVMNKVMKTVVKMKVAEKPLKEAKPRKW